MHAYGALDVFLPVMSGGGSSAGDGGDGGRGGGGGAVVGASSDVEGGGAVVGASSDVEGLGAVVGAASWGGSGAGTLVRCVAPDFDLVGVGATAEVEVTF